MFRDKISIDHHPWSHFRPPPLTLAFISDKRKAFPLPTHSPEMGRDHGLFNNRVQEETLQALTVSETQESSWVSRSQLS
jgi:hypothetical protein